MPWWLWSLSWPFCCAAAADNLIVFGTRTRTAIMFWWWKRTSDNFARIPLDVAGALYCSPMPWGPYDKFNTLIRFYRRAEIDAVAVLLTQEEIDGKCHRDLFAAYRKEGIESLHFPIPDLTTPAAADVSRLVDGLLERLQDRQRIAIHCNAGTGRTGVIAGCIVTRIRACSGDEALDYVKQHMHVDLTTSQARFVRRYAEAPKCDAPVLHPDEVRSDPKAQP